ncbi:His-Xaa-Ser system radical SAM maturase HxsB [Candidatus Parcubacteria bacterium]|nr:His-Xaa-Ser system radical SAM maturase HxsB [Patescibacteria group bacterium]MBU4309584.1 His-Xaa-Ser system radical SAM maturase HxsB [Patescibacteria group bacterium]MBU4432546.1 His-Xaa-Ser system radical SAM maturase HxsB [Patescibacteria group bacterium]MBU4578028.1 His-Xaa-Ser system radical SAM maturase HxsB [Patescibacteria group bacterium]MCG2696464.1 His-Xaa-Ser system radical SAM maturase HxsB [Candidatus Parcubacteria bacterium]
MTKNNNLAFFRFRNIGKDVLLTSASGGWMILGQSDFDDFVGGKDIAKKEVKNELVVKGFYKTDDKKILDLAGEYLRMNQSAMSGPSLFILVLTARCNHRCLYCQATPESHQSNGYNMTQITAKKTIDVLFNTPSQGIGIELQGGEPLLNWPVLKFIVKYARELNKEVKKDLKISLVSNLTLIDEEKMKFLEENRVNISCSFDGPKNIHNKNRVYLEDGNSYDAVVKKIKYIQGVIKLNRKKSEEKHIDRLNAILTVSRFSLPHAKEIIDEYIKCDFTNIFLRPLSPIGLAKQHIDVIGYKIEDFIDFYKEAMDYILKLNSEGLLFVERMSFLALKKVLQGTDSGYLEMRSPCGAGIGQMAFDYDGRVYTCDEGRMAKKMGYDNFQIGNVNESRYNDLIDNDVTKTTCLSSVLDGHVSCMNCAYKPYCGTCPLINFMEYGTLFPQLSNTDRCKMNKAMFDYLFLKLKNKKYRKIFEKWFERHEEDVK